ncbi:hypothetical protein ACIBEA_41745 [Streptomyces sp. NPDC051555]
MTYTHDEVAARIARADAAVKAAEAAQEAVARIRERIAAQQSGGAE